jgi:peroxiredoxin
VLVGFVGKLSWLLFFAGAIITGALPVAFIWIILFNSLIWLIPFYIILRRIYLQFIFEYKPLEEEFLEHHFEEVITNRGMNLKELSGQRPVLLVFLRHFGCSFCRKMLADIRAHREEVEKEGKEMVLVHMSDYDAAKKMLRKYDLQDMHHISDPERKIYRYFGLRRGLINEVAGVKTWVRWIRAAMKGHKQGFADGDTFQMPGVFLYYRGKILDKYIHKTAADQPDLVSLAKGHIHPQ